MTYYYLDINDHSQNKFSNSTPNPQAEDTK